MFVGTLAAEGSSADEVGIIRLVGISEIRRRRRGENGPPRPGLVGVASSCQQKAWSGPYVHPCVRLVSPRAIAFKPTSTVAARSRIMPTSRRGTPPPPATSRQGRHNPDVGIMQLTASEHRAV